MPKKVPSRVKLPRSSKTRNLSEQDQDESDEDEDIVLKLGTHQETSFGGSVVTGGKDENLSQKTS